MVATDTVVGIVGAVVLVAVMAGVFVYEYNNAPEGTLSVQEQQEHFEEDYVGLSATQDLDGDGVANFEDPDIDGDGLNNTEDDMLSTYVPVSGTVETSTPAAPGDAYTQSFTIGNGSEALSGTLAYTRQATGVPNLQATLTGPSGFSAVTGTSSGTTSVTITFDIQEPLPPGQYTLTISHAPLAGPLSIAPAANVSGTLEVHYASPAPGTAHDH